MSVILPVVFALVAGLTDMGPSIGEVISKPWLALILDFVLILPAGLVLELSKKQELLIFLLAMLVAGCFVGSYSIIVIIIKK